MPKVLKNDENDGYIVKIKLEQSYEIKILFEVLKDFLTDIKIDFIKDTVIEVPDNDQSSESEDESNKKKKTKKTTKKQLKKKPNKKNKKNESSSESDSDSDSDSDSEFESEDESKKSTKNKKQKTKQQRIGGGIKILALDDHAILMVYVKLNSEQFAEFYVKNDCHSIGIDAILLHKFMKSVSKDSVMKMKIDKEDEQNLAISLDNEGEHSEADYKQKLLDIDDDSKELPEETEFQMTVIMQTSLFKKICVEMNNFSEFVEITCTSKELTFKCQGDSTSFVRKFKNSSSLKITSLKNNGNGPNIFQAIFNLKYLVVFGKCTNLCPEMHLFFRNDYPMFMHYTVGKLGKLLVGLTPLDEKRIKRDSDYDDAMDKYYSSKKVVMKEEK